MKRINSLSDLLMEELSDLLSAEKHLIKALPQMAQASQLPALKSALEDHVEVIKEQADRLQDVFSNIGQSSHWVISNAMKRLVREIEEIVDRTEKGNALDVDIIGVAQRVIHYKIVGYQTACEHASDLGHTRIVELLNETLDEERAVNLRLSELAQGMINIQAIDPAASQQPKGKGFYVPEGKFGRGGIKKKGKNKDVSRFINEGNPNLDATD